MPGCAQVNYVAISCSLYKSIIVYHSVVNRCELSATYSGEILGTSLTR
jgi:hypothetical protein